MFPSSIGDIACCDLWGFFVVDKFEVYFTYSFEMFDNFYEVGNFNQSISKNPDWLATWHSWSHTPWMGGLNCSGVGHTNHAYWGVVGPPPMWLGYEVG